VGDGEKAVSMTQRFEDLIGAESLPAANARFLGFSELSKGLLLSLLVQKTTSPWLVVFATKVEARNFVDNYCYFSGKAHSDRVHYLPSADFDFYRGILPNPEILCERNASLFHALNDPQGRVFVTTLTALLQKVVPPQEYLRATQILKVEAEIDRDALIAGLQEAGYQRQPAAQDPGVFSVRGGVIDIFCPLYRQPLRLEFYGDFIEEIRFFEPASQRSLDRLAEASIIPVGQSILPQGAAFEEAATKVKDRFDHLGIPKMDRDEILEKVHNRSLPTELSFLFPLLSKGSAPITDYFPKDLKFIWDGRPRLLDQAEEKDIPVLFKNQELFEKAPQPIATQQELFLSLDEFREKVSGSGGYSFETFESSETEIPTVTLSSEPVSLEQERKELGHKSGSSALLETFAQRFRAWMDQGYRIQIVCHTLVHADRIHLLFEPYDLRAVTHTHEASTFQEMMKTDFSVLNLWQGVITQSQLFPLLKLVILSEDELFGRKKRAAKASAWASGSQPAKLLSGFRDLKVGDYIVHKDHGIGKYLGLKSMNFLGTPNDYVLLEYREGDKLYVPVYRLNVIQKYTAGENTAPPIDKLGGDRWDKAKKKAQGAVAELAAEFLKTHALRKLIPAFRFAEPNQDFHEFEMEFPFDETPDQMKAIDDVMADLSREYPMDRLVCGDVGYGKTEVAMRAAYRAVLDGKQVAILVPTTVLAFQHFESFKSRFKTTGTRVELVSRMKSSAEIKNSIEQLRSGKVDVIIGTHRLLSADVVFKDLGVVVVDEEHRFGVVHKEKLKKLCESVHVLSMTATPIPRTLNMAMTGLKDISIITTPPPDRLSVRTFVCKRSEEVIVEAISNELIREGQIFFVHNRIETIFKVADELRQLFPKVKTEIVHGQMEGSELEERMLRFYRGEAQILLTTAIIESGLDVPRANTIIIDQADHFGLAQLYQLRGRVGRSDKRAYCYMLAPPETAMTEDAKQRLQVIQRYTELGSGFNIASHDLEIRGAGDMLGKSQSGHLTAVGVDLYFDLLDEAISELQGKEKRVEIEPEINLKIAAYFPEDYLPDIGERISIYRRLSGAESEERISEIETEIRDRFGNPPEEVINLLGLMHLKLHLKKLHVVRMSVGPKKTSLQFAPSTPASPEKLVKLVTAQKYAWTPDQKLVFNSEGDDWRVLLREVQRLTDELVN
jgi:transcription-repair coupling factor (superfamily II helicase)